MTQQEITENNKLIAEFMGLWETETGYLYIPQFEKGYRLEQMEFHISWGWLFPVVEQINDLGHVVTIRSSGYVQIEGEDLPFIIEEDGDNPLQSTYDACVDFIKWYNENK